IEENDCPPLNLDRWPAVTVLAFPSFQFMSFSRCCFVDRFGRNTETFHNFSIENCYSSRRQSSHRKFLLSRNSQFSYDEHVERSVEPLPLRSRPEHRLAAGRGQRRRSCLQTLRVPRQA